MAKLVELDQSIQSSWTERIGLITRRSEVQILPPPPREPVQGLAFVRLVAIRPQRTLPSSIQSRHRRHKRHWLNRHTGISDARRKAGLRSPDARCRAG